MLIREKVGDFRLHPFTPRITDDDLALTGGSLTTSIDQRRSWGSRKYEQGRIIEKWPALKNT